MKETQTPTIIVAEPHSAERVYGVLTLAFADDPANRWLFSEAEQYLRHFPAFAVLWEALHFICEQHL